MPDDTNRAPFIGLPVGCPQLSFNIDIVPTGFPFVDVPEVDQPVIRPMSFNLDIPDNIPPPFCPGISAQGPITGTVTVGDSGSTTATLSVGGDACNPEVGIALDITIPCLPSRLTVGDAASMTIAEPGVLPSQDGCAFYQEDCNFTLDLKMQQACTPTGVTATATGGLYNDAGTVKLLDLTDSLDMQAHMVAGCEMTIALDIKLPDLRPFPWGSRHTFGLELVGCTLEIYNHRARRGSTEFTGGPIGLGIGGANGQWLGWEYNPAGSGSISIVGPQNEKPTDGDGKMRGPLYKISVADDLNGHCAVIIDEIAQYGTVMLALFADPN